MLLLSISLCYTLFVEKNFSIYLWKEIPMNGIKVLQNELFSFPKDMVEYGEIICVYSFSVAYFSYYELVVSPHSAIKWHQHQNLLEWYISVKTGHPFFYSIGEYHMFENSTDVAIRLVCIQKKNP